MFRHPLYVWMPHMFGCPPEFGHPPNVWASKGMGNTGGCLNIWGHPNIQGGCLNILGVSKHMGHPNKQGDV